MFPINEIYYLEHLHVKFLYTEFVFISEIIMIKLKINILVQLFGLIFGKRICNDFC